jgi:hypothetical protein
MPPLEVLEGSDGELMIWNGATRATRVAKFLPGTPVVVQVTGKVKNAIAGYPTVGDNLP